MSVDCHTPLLRENVDLGAYTGQAGIGQRQKAAVALFVVGAQVELSLGRQGLIEHIGVIEDPGTAACPTDEAQRQRGAGPAAQAA
jgi:hypothetical protein